MPATASDDGVVLGLKFDISRVKQTLDQVKNMVRDMAADSAKAVSKTDDTLEKARKNAEKWKIEPSTKGIEAAQKELDILNATIVNQQNELSNCEREHERLADKYGETSSQALKLEKRMLSLQASIEKNTKKSDDFGAALADAQDVMDAASGSAEDLEKNAKGAGKGMEDGGKGAKTFDVALGTLAGNALSAVIGKCGELMEQTKELRRDLSFLEQNARDAGMGMEQLHNKAGELYAVTGDTNEVVEALSNMPSADAISVTYRDGEYSIQYPEWSETVDMFDHPNVFIVEVDNPDLDSSMRAVSVNDRPDSIFSIVNLGRRVVSYEKLDNIASQAELQAYADNKRFKSLQSTETRTFYTGPSGRHAVFDLVELVRDGESTLYEETGWRLELEQPYKMTHTGKRVVYL